MREMGATEQQIEQRLSHLTPDEQFLVFAENWPILLWFLHVNTYLIWVGTYCARLDVTAIKDDAKMSGRKIKPKQYQRLKVMFDEYCNAINKQNKSRR